MSQEEFGCAILSEKQIQLKQLDFEQKQKAASEIKDVWRDNFKEEFDKIEALIE